MRFKGTKFAAIPRCLVGVRGESEVGWAQNVSVLFHETVAP